MSASASTCRSVFDRPVLEDQPTTGAVVEAALAFTLRFTHVAIGFRPFLKPEVQAPIIVAFLARADLAYDFKTFYPKTESAATSSPTRAS